MIVSQSSLPTLRKHYADMRIVYTSGSFDILHVGHLELLTWAKSKGDILVVALNSDAVIRQKKGPSRPIIPLEDRKELLDGLGMVDYVLAVDGDDASTMPWLETVSLLCPDVCVLGPDWANQESSKWKMLFPNADILTSPPRRGPSTTSLIEKILSLSNTDQSY